MQDNLGHNNILPDFELFESDEISYDDSLSLVPLMNTTNSFVNTTEFHEINSLMQSRKRTFSQIEPIDSFDTNDYETKLFKQSLLPVSCLKIPQPTTIITQPSNNIEFSQENNIIREDILINTFNILLDIYNLDDDMKLYALIHRYSALNLHINILEPKQIHGYSPNAFFVFFYLSRELYPDSMFKVLERRVNKQANKEGLMTIEYIYKFTGTRITKFLMIELYHEIINHDLHRLNTSSYEELSSYLVHRITNNTLPSTDMKNDISSMICSALLTFNTQNQLIEQIDIELLAYN